MNETLQTIKTRYSCRSYTGEALEKEKVEAIALAGVQSPSGLNKQPWKISVLQNKDMIGEMDAALMKKLAAQEDRSAYDRMMSRGGIVAENMALAASSLGLGNVICGMAGMLINDEIGAAYKDKLIPEGYEFGVALLVGYPTNPNGTPHEPDLSKIVYVE